MGYDPYSHLLPLSDPLASTFAKLHRAGELYVSLEEAMDAFLRSEPFAVEMSREDDGWIVVRFHPLADPPIRLALICADFLSNLRAALDHTIYALARLRSGADPERTAFPILMDEAEYRRPRGSAKISYRDSMLAGLSEDDKLIVDHWQPFNNPRSPLVGLQHFNNRDKHRLLASGFVGVDNMSVIPGSPMEGLDLRINEATYRGLFPGDELFRAYPVNPESPTGELICENVVSVTFGDRTLGMQSLHVFHVEVIHVIETLVPVFPDSGHYGHPPEPPSEGGTLDMVPASAEVSAPIPFRDRIATAVRRFLTRG